MTGSYYEVSEPVNFVPPHSVYYLPSINQSPTKMDTVQEVLLQAKAKAEAVGLRESDVVLDHAIYCKALDIMMNPENIQLKDFINLRMGGFHASCIFIAVIGKRFGSAGLRDIIESGIVGTGVAESVIKGKQYNRAVRVLKTLYEAMQRLKFEAFEEWLIKEKKEQIFTDFIESIEFTNLMKERNSFNLEICLEKFTELFSLFEQYEESIINKDLGPMATFWNTFIGMVQILLDFIKSIRICDWDLHLQAIERMLCWFHAYDHINYARHFTLKVENFAGTKFRGCTFQVSFASIKFRGCTSQLSFASITFRGLHLPTKFRGY